MRETPILINSFYHIYNRGNQKQILFHDKADYARFMYLLLYFQSSVTFTKTNRVISHFAKRGTYNVSKGTVEDILKKRTVEVVNYCIMPNHFHLTIQNTTENGIPKYMHRVSNAYAKYFNKRYEKTGHVFQGTYKARLIDTDKQLVYLSAYIHNNPRELKKWKNSEIGYPWSSYQDYKINRWGKLLVPKCITETFNSFSEYSQYIKNSGAKETEY